MREREIGKKRVKKVQVMHIWCEKILCAAHSGGVIGFVVSLNVEYIRI